MWWFSLSWHESFMALWNCQPTSGDARETTWHRPHISPNDPLWRERWGHLRERKPGIPVHTTRVNSRCEDQRLIIKFHSLKCSVSIMIICHFNRLIPGIWLENNAWDNDIGRSPWKQILWESAKNKSDAYSSNPAVCIGCNSDLLKLCVSQLHFWV